MNYDLPWTPLKLIQRVGRVDRFILSPREIEVNNFFPGGPEYEAIVSLWSRLLKRDGEASAVSGFSSVGDHHRVPETLAASAISARWLHQVASGTVDLEQLRTDTSANLPPTRLFDTLWGARPADREAAASLPDGVQAITVGRNPGLYVLLRGETSTEAFHISAAGELTRAPQPHSHEHLLAQVDPPKRSTRGTVITSQNIDVELSDALERWSAEGDLGLPDSYALVAALKIVASPTGISPRLHGTARSSEQQQLTLPEI